MATLSPNMEAVQVPGQISGAAIIDDLCQRIRDRLSRDCSLSQSDAYAGYAARVTVELQLKDVDITEVAPSLPLLLLQREIYLCFL